MMGKKWLSLCNTSYNKEEQESPWVNGLLLTVNQQAHLLNAVCLLHHINSSAYAIFFHIIELTWNFFPHFILDFSAVSNNVYPNQEQLGGNGLSKTGGQTWARVPASPRTCDSKAVAVWCFSHGLFFFLKLSATHVSGDSLVLCSRQTEGWNVNYKRHERGPLIGSLDIVSQANRVASKCGHLHQHYLDDSGAWGDAQVTNFPSILV